MADKDFNTTQLNSITEDPERIGFALAEITEMAAAIRDLSDKIIEGTTIPDI